jgi:hypothetical protein
MPARVQVGCLVLAACVGLTGSVLLNVPNTAADVEQLVRETNASLAIYFFSPTCSLCPQFTPVTPRCQ